MKLRNILLTFVLLAPWVVISYPIFPVVKYRTETLYFTSTTTTVYIDMTREYSMRIGNGAYLAWTFTRTRIDYSTSTTYLTLSSTEVQNFLARSGFEMWSSLSILILGLAAVAYIYARLGLLGGSKRNR